MHLQMPPGENRQFLLIQRLLFADLGQFTATLSSAFLLKADRHCVEARDTQHPKSRRVNASLAHASTIRR